jgi:hypothetical protein
MPDKLTIQYYETDGVYVIQWELEDGKPGAVLGDDENEEDLKEIASMTDEDIHYNGEMNDFFDTEHALAIRSIMNNKMNFLELRDFGLCWHSHNAAQIALDAANQAIEKFHKGIETALLPEWAKTALSNGWKMPDGWKP